MRRASSPKRAPCWRLMRGRRNTMPPCEQCGQPLQRDRCDACDGYSGRWVDRGDGEDYWLPCGRCDDQGHALVCRNWDCPSRRWFQVNSAEHAIAERAVRKQVLAS